MVTLGNRGQDDRYIRLWPRNILLPAVSRSCDCHVVQQRSVSQYLLQSWMKEVMVLTANNQSGKRKEGIIVLCLVLFSTFARETLILRCVIIVDVFSHQGGWCIFNLLSTDSPASSTSEELSSTAPKKKNSRWTETEEKFSSSCSMITKTSFAIKHTICQNGNLLQLNYTRDAGENTFQATRRRNNVKLKWAISQKNTRQPKTNSVPLVMEKGEMRRLTRKQKAELSLCLGIFRTWTKFSASEKPSILNTCWRVVPPDQITEYPRNWSGHSWQRNFRCRDCRCCLRSKFKEESCRIRWSWWSNRPILWSIHFWLRGRPATCLRKILVFKEQRQKRKVHKFTKEYSKECTKKCTKESKRRKESSQKEG